MGNTLFRRKKIVAEELEELQKRGESLEAQIRRSITTKQTIQWFSSLSLLFLTFVSIGFSFINVSDKSLRTAYSAASVVAGFLLLYCFRRMTNEYYSWSIQRKVNAREEVAKRKREILEKVKETETFKVAKEILEKYDDEVQVPDPTHHPSAPRLSLAPNQTIGTPNTSRLSSLNTKEKRLDKPDESVKEIKADDELDDNTFEGNLQAEGRPMHFLSPKPPRPFFKPQRTVAEKVVDFIIGDAPTDRFALICSHCYGHNGMARKEEFDFLSYRCWMCGEFNPARRQKRPLTLTQTQSEENLTTRSNNMQHDSQEEAKNELEGKRSRAKTRSSSHQRPLTTTDLKASQEVEENGDATE